MKISIITPTFNSEQTLEATIKSIILQDYKNLEYIIIDGMSTDRTFDIISKYNWFINQVISEKDKGISDAFNKGIKIATGEIIGIINSDDQLCPNSLNFIAKEVLTNTDVIYGKGYRLLKNGKMIEYNQKPITDLYNCMALMHPAVFIKRSAYDKFGLYDVKLKACMDRDLLLRMYHKGAKFQFIDNFLAIYRMGGESQSNYFETTLFEREKISIKFGMNIWKAKLQTINAYIKMKIIFLLKL